MSKEKDIIILKCYFNFVSQRAMLLNILLIISISYNENQVPFPLLF